MGLQKITIAYCKNGILNTQIRPAPAGTRDQSRWPQIFFIFSDDARRGMPAGRLALRAIAAKPNFRRIY